MNCFVMVTPVVPADPNTVSYKVTLTATGAPLELPATAGTRVTFNAASGLSIVGTSVGIDSFGNPGLASDPVTFLVPTEVLPLQPGPVTFGVLSTTDNPADPTLS